MGHGGEDEQVSGTGQTAQRESNTIWSTDTGQRSEGKRQGNGHLFNQWSRTSGNSNLQKIKINKSRARPHTHKKQFQVGDRSIKLLEVKEKIWMAQGSWVTF
jgi:hypothetical protein